MFQPEFKLQRLHEIGFFYIAFFWFLIPIWHLMKLMTISKCFEYLLRVLFHIVYLWMGAQKTFNRKLEKNRHNICPTTRSMATALCVDVFFRPKKPSSFDLDGVILRVSTWPTNYCSGYHVFSFPRAPRLLPDCCFQTASQVRQAWYYISERLSH